MPTLIGTRRFLAALRAEAFPLPENCAAARLKIPADGVFELEYRVFVTPENLGKLGRALQRIAVDVAAENVTPSTTTTPTNGVPNQ